MHEKEYEMRNCQDACHYNFLAITKIRKKLYKAGDKAVRANIVAKICKEFNVDEKHIRNIMEG